MITRDGDAMPKVPEPTPQEIRELLRPVMHWAHLKRHAEVSYRQAIIAAHLARIPHIHISRYTGTSPQAVRKVIDRGLNPRTEREANAGPAASRP
ncbi:hypothetical protein [Tsukamurella pseudospumae]|uniref:hypothetical protein n=1 Tax=Tsukamurella pseudospumae TaxID=239498 RepID=UPI0012E971B5|nr:hypothetical protein [Tsukamurella pseudospumae]